MLKKNGKPRLVSSYSQLQTRFFEHMQQAGFTDFERGIQGSTAQHLDVLEYKVQQDRQAVTMLADQKRQLQGQKKELVSQIGAISGSIRDVQDIEANAKVKGVLGKAGGTAAAGFSDAMRDGKSWRQTDGRKPQPAQAVEQSRMRAQDLRQRLERCEAQLAALREETSLYREAMRHSAAAGADIPAWHPAPPAAEQQLNRAQRRQRAKGQER